jgi:AP2 domain/HNH endonuclease
VLSVRTVILHGRLADGKVALVDDADYDLVSQYRWRVWQRRKQRVAGPYAVTAVCTGGSVITLYMHKMLAPEWPLVDHINHDGLDNRRENLRPASRAQNARNARPHGRTSLYKGVCWYKAGRQWEARIRHDGQRIYLGRFADETAAALAYDAAARRLFGEYAYLNFPD